VFISGLLTGGLDDGASVLMVLSKEPPRSIRMLLRSQGLDAESFEEEGHLRIVDWFSWRGERIIGVEKDGYALKSSKILSNLGIAINKGLRELSFSTNKMALVHIIGPAMNIFEFSQVYNFIQRLRAKYKEEEMASIFFLESETLSRESLTRIMEVFDGVIEMNKTMESGKLRRELSILSMSGIDFDANPIPFVVRDSKMVSIEEIEKVERKKLSKIIAQVRSTTSTSGDEEIEEMEEVGEDEVILLKDAIKKNNLDDFIINDKGEARLLPKSEEEIEVLASPRRKHDKQLMEKVKKVISKEGTPKDPKKVSKRVVRKRKKPTNAMKPPGTEIIGTKRKSEEMAKTSQEDIHTFKKKRVRHLVNISNPEHDSHRKILNNIGDGPEEILLEAIATIDDLLEGSENTLSRKNIQYMNKRKK
jgi:KaiC/GvpD/RAD55 family RecA-like ATPase